MTSIGRGVFFLFLMMLVTWSNVVAQNEQLGKLQGQIVDKDSKETLVGANIAIVGTYKGASTNIDGYYVITGIKPGTYAVKIQYLGYQTKQYNEITIKAGETTKLDVKLSGEVSGLGEVEVVGRKSQIDLELAASEVTITRQELAEMNSRDVQEVVAMQAGVIETPDGLQIRGARVYETEYLVDGISAQDPLAGTGFGVNLASSSIGSMSVTTGGAGAEFGGGSSGVINTTIREGGDRFELSGSWQRDFFYNPNVASSFNTDIVELTMGTPIPGTKNKLTIFNNVTAMITDEYFGPTAEQLNSSLFPNNPTIWAPRYSNVFTHTFKMAYQIKPGTKLTFTNQASVNINQNTRTLQIVGFDAILVPGFQYRRSNNLDNATTYTHRSVLSAVNLKHMISKKWGMSLSAGRLFTNLRADANGRPFREETVDQIYDEQNIITDPVQIFNPNDPSGTFFVLPGDGLVNNGGITPLWHDHYAQEYTLRGKVTYDPGDRINLISMGFTHIFTEYQWADVTRPWVGAPIRIDDSTFTPSVSIGSSSDIWAVRPQNGGIFVEDRITYKGIIATLGMRLNYWAPGRFADDAIADPNSPVIDQTRQDYMDKTVGLMGLRWKARLLPRVNVSFPVTENNVMYFNYGHSMRLPHPRFLYAGLDPVFQDRSFLSSLGNPDLDPEVNVSYEVGVKSMLNKNLVVSLAAFNNNRFDYIVARSAIVRDQTGRPVTKTIYINQDYAKIMGVEGGFQYRFLKHLNAFGNVSYQVARGKSNTARESALQIAQTGEIQLAREQYLAFDRPWNINAGVIFTPDSTFRVLGKRINGFRAFLSYRYTSGFRYTPQVKVSENDLGRPEYEERNDRFLEEIATPWINFDLKLSYDWMFSKHTGLVFSVEVRNMFNHLNAQIINPVTGRAYEFGDDVPLTWRDPRPEFNGPQETGVDPRNPARYLAPRQVLYGIAFRF